MKPLIVGHYDLQDEAETAARDVMRAGFSASEMCLFYLNPQGQHAIHPVGGDEDESPGTHDAQSGAVRGAAGGAGAGVLVGAATIPVLGPAGPLLGAAVGAYTGSLVGALNSMEEPPETHTGAVRNSDAADADIEARKSGYMLAVAVQTPMERKYAIEILGERAQLLEEAKGHLENGEWIDFDPLAPPHVIR
ncbi:MAG: hypothetical protein Q7J36_14170 [Thiobacillus sp.]|nr:hypothetical protein [Thiobacillus sp.]